MASSVQIQISVDPTDSGAKIGAVKGELEGLGTAGVAAGAKAGQGMQQMTGHVATGLDSVRLLSQEFGLRMPRAIEAMLSRMPGVTSALSSIIGVMAGIAAIEIFARAVEGAKKLYDEFFDVNAQMREYLEKAGQAENTKFIDQASIETATASLESLNAQIDKLDRKRVASGVDQPGGGLLQYAPAMAPLLFPDPTLVAHALTSAPKPIYSSDDGVARAKDAQDQAGEDQRVHELKRQYDEEDLKNQAKLNEAGLTGAALIAQKQKDAHAANAAAQQQELQRELDQQKTMQAQRDLQIQMGVKDPTKLVNVPFVDQNAGGEARKLADAAADIDATAQSAALNKEMQLDIMKANDQRVQAGLQGEALYFEKMRADIRELTLELENQGKAAEIPARVRAINEKYFDDLSERQVKAQNESGAGVRRASASGLTGAARIYADQDIQVNENNTRLASDPEAQHAANVAAATEANQKIEALQQQFAERMGQIEDAQTERTLNGYARIDAAAQKQIDRVKDDYQKDFGGAGVDQNSGPAIAAQKARQDAITAIQADAGAQRSQLQQANNAEDLRYDQEAMQAEARVRSDGTLGWVASYRNAVAEINAQEQQRLAKIQEDATKEGLTYEEVARRRADIEQTANAQMEEQTQQLQHQIAGTLESAFQDPIGTIKSQMEKLMFDILASWLIHLKAFQSAFGGIIGGITPGGGSAGIAGAAQGVGGIAGGAISNLIHGGAGGGTQAVAGSVAGSAPVAGTSVAAGSTPTPAFRAPYSGNSGVVAGAGSSGSISSDIGDVRGLTGYFGGGSTSDATPAVASATSTSDNVSFDDQGNASYTGMIPDEPTPQYQIPPSQSGLGTAMGYIGAAGAAYSAEQTTVSAFDQGSAQGVLSGTLGDAAAGATIGSVIPGIGTAVGAAVGAAVGFASGLAGAVLGMGGKIAARDYYEKTIFPALEADRLGQGGDPMSAISDLNRTSSQGFVYMQSKFGEQAADWVKAQYMDKEVALAASQISQHAEGGSEYLQRQGVEFHGGGYVSDFGDLAAGGSEGWAKLLLGESVNTQQATSTHAPVINAMNSGASPSDVAAMYLQSVRSSGGATTSTPSSGDTHFHIHTLDTKTMKGWLRDGGAQMISKAQNNLAGQYAGEGVLG